MTVGLRRWLGPVLAASCLFSAGCGSERETAPRQPTFTFAMSGMYKPFNFRKQGRLVGFDVDIGNEIARRMGHSPMAVSNPWETIIQALKAGKYDAIIGSMAITPKRQEQVAFSRPYYRSGAQGFIRAENTATTHTEAMAGKRIGVVKASTFRDVALTLTDPDKVVGYDSDVIALQDLTTGRIDAVITDQVVGFSAMHENALPIRDVGEPLYVDEMGIAFRPESTELRAAVNQALEAMIDDGTYDRISRRWFNRNILGE